MIKCRECEISIVIDLYMGYCEKCYKKMLAEIKREEVKG